MHINTSKKWRRSIVSFSGAFALRLVLRWDLITELLHNLCSGSQLSIVRGFLSWILWNPSHWILFTSETTRGLVVVWEDDQILPTPGGELRKKVLQMSLIDVWVKSIVSYGCPLYGIYNLYLIQIKSNVQLSSKRIWNKHKSMPHLHLKWMSVCISVWDWMCVSVSVYECMPVHCTM